MIVQMLLFVCESLAVLHICLLLCNILCKILNILQPI